METIKLYQFYILGDAMGDAYYSNFIEEFSIKMRKHEDIYYLYAWCTTKEARDLFKVYRDMSIFIVITDEVSEEEFNSFHSKYLDFSLKIEHLQSKFCDLLPVACTVYEMETIYSEYDDQFNSIVSLPDAGIYNMIFLSLSKELQKAILQTGFREFMDAKLIELSGETPMLDVDELSVLLGYYGNTFIADERND